MKMTALHHEKHAGRSRHSGTVCRCAKCHIAVHVIESPPPPVCPFCHGGMEIRPFELPPPEKIAVERDVEEHVRRLYRKPPRLLVLTLFLIGTLLLSFAVYFQVNNIEHYYYAPLVNIYSLIVGLFIVSRFILASFYTPPPRKDFRPTVSVLVPCMNEEKSIAQSIARVYAEGYPDELREVVTVNDGSTDNTLHEMLRAQAAFPKLVVVNFERNRGLCYGMAYSTLLARGEVCVYVDSDTFLMPGAVEKLVQGFHDPTVGGIAGHTDVENADVNVLTKMQDVRYFFSYKIMKAAESVYGVVSCLPGCFSAYRRTCVLHVMDEWMKEKVFGVSGNYGDDRSLTNLILRDYQVLYDDEALATTIAPEKWGVYTRQQARWMRSSVRGILSAASFIWRKHPVPALSWYAMMILPIIEPFIMVQALVLAPIRSGEITSSYVFGVMIITLVWSLYHLQKTGRRHWWAGFVFTATYIVFFSWQIYYAIFTMATRKWGTRGGS
jgi:hyaluronan synthase